MNKRKILGLIAILPILLMVSCLFPEKEGEPSEVFPVPQAVRIELHQEMDTVDVIGPTYLNYSVSFTNADLSFIRVELDGKFISKSDPVLSNGSIYIHPHYLENGYHVLTVYLTLDSNNGSMADRVGTDFNTYEKSWVIYTEKTYPTSLKFIEVKDSLGAVFLKWEKTDSKRFKNYTLSTNEGFSRVITDPDQNFAFDSLSYNSSILYILSHKLNDGKTEGTGVYHYMTAPYIERIYTHSFDTIIVKLKNGNSLVRDNITKARLRMGFDQSTVTDYIREIPFTLGVDSVILTDLPLIDFSNIFIDVQNPESIEYYPLFDKNPAKMLEFNIWVYIRPEAEYLYTPIPNHLIQLAGTSLGLIAADPTIYISTSDYPVTKRIENVKKFNYSENHLYGVIHQYAPSISVNALKSIDMLQFQEDFTMNLNPSTEVVFGTTINNNGIAVVFCYNYDNDQPELSFFDLKQKTKIHSEAVLGITPKSMDLFLSDDADLLILKSSENIYKVSLSNLSVTGIVTEVNQPGTTFNMTSNLEYSLNNTNIEYKDLYTNQNVILINSPGEAIDSLLYMPENKWLVGFAPQHAYVYDSKTGEYHGRFRRHEEQTQLVGNYLIRRFFTYPLSFDYVMNYE